MAHFTGITRKGIMSDPLDQAILNGYVRIVALATVELRATDVQVGGHEILVVPVVTIQALVGHAAHQQGGVLTVVRLVAVQTGSLGRRFIG